MPDDSRHRAADDWLWGWDPTPGIVSVWAEDDGRAFVWRRDPHGGALVREEARFRPWLLLRSVDGLAATAGIEWRELDGPGELRFLSSAPHGAALARAVCAARGVRHLRELVDRDEAIVLPSDEQYLVASGRTYFRDLAFDHLQRLQFDLETTGLDARRDRIFLVAVRTPAGEHLVLETDSHDDAGEAALIRRLLGVVAEADPDVVENHNLHGFDLPFLEARARRLGVRLGLGRLRVRGGGSGLLQRGARRGAAVARADGADDGRRVRFIAPGRELIDTMDAVRRYDQTVRDLPGYGLKALARHFGIAGPARELIPGAEIFDTYLRDPARVRRYATADVDEVAALSRLLGGAAFALARLAPRRYERLADAGAATGVIDPLLVRAYLREGMALPAREEGDGTVHSGAALHLFATGVAHRVVKADVASLYPSLMRSFRIGPARDHLGALLAIVDRFVETRLAAKARARAAPRGSAERHEQEALSAAMKMVVNSAYGYLAAGGALTRFADVHAANDVTRRGREVLALLCREFAARGVTLIEADTDGVYFAVPEGWSEADERRVVAEVAGLLPPLVQLEFEGRYAAMLSHEAKNYALLGYDGTLLLRGVAFRSSRMEPFGEAFLRRAVARLLAGDVAGVREVYLDTVRALARREVSAHDVSSRVRLTKSPEEYLRARESRRELPYEAMLAAGRRRWSVGERVRVYRAAGGAARLAPEQPEGDGATGEAAPRDYDVAWYTRLLRDSFASRLARAFTERDFAAVFPEPDQLSLFAPAIADARTVLTGTAEVAQLLGTAGAAR